MLASLAPVVTQALAFEVRRGGASAGAQVRDAACFVLWAAARAYSPATLRALITEHPTAALPAPPVQHALLCVALCDRVLPCRRAAAAALQECAGRVPGLVECGPELSALLDFTSLRYASVPRTPSPPLHVRGVALL